MSARSIVGTAHGSSIQWVFEGTQIRVVDVKRDVLVNGPAAARAYAAMGLSHAEISAALAFEFPPVRAPHLEIEFVALTVHCECGDRIWATVNNQDGLVQCICGRAWRVPLRLEASQEALPEAARESGRQPGNDVISLETSLLARAKPAVD